MMISTKSPSRRDSSFGSYLTDQSGSSSDAASRAAADGFEAQKQSFANTWKAHNLEVVFSTDSKAYVGWSRIRGRTLGKSFVKEWAAAFWDKGPYVECIEQSRGAQLIPY